MENNKKNKRGKDKMNNQIEIDTTDYDPISESTIGELEDKQYIRDLLGIDEY